MHPRPQTFPVQPTKNPILLFKFAITKKSLKNSPQTLPQGLRLSCKSIVVSSHTQSIEEVLTISMKISTDKFFQPALLKSINQNEINALLNLAHVSVITVNLGRRITLRFLIEINAIV
jgi:hypothetical protein